MRSIMCLRTNVAKTLAARYSGKISLSVCVILDTEKRLVPLYHSFTVLGFKT